MLASSAKMYKRVHARVTAAAAPQQQVHTHRARTHIHIHNCIAPRPWGQPVHNAVQLHNATLGGHALRDADLYQLQQQVHREKCPVGGNRCSNSCSNRCSNRCTERGVQWAATGAATATATGAATATATGVTTATATGAQRVVSDGRQAALKWESSKIKTQQLLWQCLAFACVLSSIFTTAIRRAGCGCLAFG